MLCTVAIDWSKAFDSFPHGLLIAKLRPYEVDLSSCKLIARDLNTRLQRYINKRQKDRFFKLRKGSTPGLRFGPFIIQYMYMTIPSILKNATYTVMVMITSHHLLEPLLIHFEWCWVKKAIIYMIDLTKTPQWLIELNFKLCVYLTRNHTTTPVLPLVTLMFLPLTIWRFLVFALTWNLILINIFL